MSVCIYCQCVSTANLRWIVRAPKLIIVYCAGDFIAIVEGRTKSETWFNPVDNFWEGVVWLIHMESSTYSSTEDYLFCYVQKANISISLRIVQSPRDKKKNKNLQNDATRNVIGKGIPSDRQNTLNTLSGSVTSVQWYLRCLSTWSFGNWPAGTATTRRESPIAIPRPQTAYTWIPLTSQCIPMVLRTNVAIVVLPRR